MSISLEVELMNRSLDAALKAFIEGDESKMEKHVSAYQIEMPSNPLSYRAGVMKVAECRQSLPETYRLVARRWLKKNGFKPLGASP